ncbi:MAG: FAD-binding oxidoreductase [Planctomycetes bacterium]|nr:FAD-binding oxidoreductase [Planctomycetota bacterium]
MGTTPALLDRLTALLGAGAVSVDEAAFRELPPDLTEIPSRDPDVVVRATTVAQIQSLLRLANETRTPVTPVITNTNVGGLAIPTHGGIVLDLRGMNRILEINADDLYAVIEPGVSWGQLKEALEKEHPELRFAYSLSPPETSIVANHLMDGLSNLSLRHGATGQWINAIEAVLPTGELMRAGSAAWSSSWCSRSPMPDLVGLFVNFHGTTGIVTKMAVQLWPNPKFRRRVFVLAYRYAEGYRFLRRLVRAELCDDIGGLSWPLGKMLFGDPHPVYHDPAEPVLFCYLDISAHFEREFQARLETLEELLAAERREGARFDGPLDIAELVSVEPGFQKFAEFPTRLDFLLDHPGGGLTWIGTYGPFSQMDRGVEAGAQIMERHGFPPAIVSRPMRGGHFAVLRLLAIFDRKNAAEVERVAAMNRELVDAVLPMGFLPYKTPAWVLDRHGASIDPVFRRLVGTIQTAMDPNGILNPGRWLKSPPRK